MPRALITLRPRSPLRLPARSADGTIQGDRGCVRRLIHLGERPVVLTAVHQPGGTVALAAEAEDAADAEAGLERARFWTGVDDDLEPFLTRFAKDPRIGASVREAPWLRPYRRPMPFDVLLGAVCEQLITDERARAIRRRIVHHHGRRAHGLLDVPTPADVAALAPAQLERCGLAAKRAITLIQVAREVAAGRAPLLESQRHEEGWRRLRTIPGIGPWTLSTLALHGQGHPDALPAGDHAYRALVGRHLAGAGTLAGEADVLAFFAPYAGWRGVAGWHLLRSARGARSRRG